jgi:hypothetical protein
MEKQEGITSISWARLLAEHGSLKPSAPWQASIRDRAQVASYPRESNDTPSSDAFFRVAPSVRLSDFAIFAAGAL